eukprot:TRINITY_DN3061_c0_g1_i11.p2 TRINITY_DN3061_c0_g1~~TRINITY_DN3061_c0_g1_i11.p2  ORF type:complete len:123 (+),score=33.94 TRINITY_DN3061_c0_g1_i11:246-614(+)
MLLTRADEADQSCCSKESLSQEIESILKKLIENIDDASQQTQEEKSDNETLILDEEYAETPTLFEIEILTKEGVKKLEFRQSDESSEVAGKIAQQYGLNKNVETAIEYRLRKALIQVNDQLI